MAPSVALYRRQRACYYGGICASINSDNIADAASCIERSIRRVSSWRAAQHTLARISIWRNIIVAGGNGALQLLSAALMALCICRKDVLEVSIAQTRAAARRVAKMTSKHGLIDNALGSIGTLFILPRSLISLNRTKRRA